MKIAPLNQNNVNFKSVKGFECSKEVLEAISTTTKEVFDELVLPNRPKNKKVLFPALKKVLDNASDKTSDGIAWGVGKLANTKPSKAIVKGLSHFKKPSARMADLTSFVITFFYVNNTRKSKKIDEERKMPLMINNIAVTAVSSTMAALIDAGSDVFIDKVKTGVCAKQGEKILDGVIKKVPKLAEKSDESLKELGKTILQSQEFKLGLKDYTKRVEKAKSLTIFSFVVRFLVTVLMVPVAGKIVDIVKEKLGKKPENKNDNQQQKADEVKK